MSSPKWTVVFVLGGPGSGKGTQCAKIVEKYGFVHLSAGDLLREERKSGSEVATLINDYINRGAIVPVEITIGLLEKAMKTSGANKFLVDGFPRNAENLAGWETVMKDKAEVKFVLYLECPAETCIARVIERGVTSGRTDDNIEVMRKRLQTYEIETRPIIDIFTSRGLTRSVDSTVPVDQVFAEVSKLFDALVSRSTPTVVAAAPAPVMNTKRLDYLSWDDYFMAVAFLSAQRSKDPSTQVGACIVNKDKKIVGIGYNGMPNGCDDDALPWARQADNYLDTKYPYVCHAELNAILNKNAADIAGATIYVGLFPCNDCAKLIIQSGIRHVVYISDKYHTEPHYVASRRLFDLAKVTYTQYIPTAKKVVIDFSAVLGYATRPSTVAAPAPVLKQASSQPSAAATTAAASPKDAVVSKEQATPSSAPTDQSPVWEASSDPTIASGNTSVPAKVEEKTEEGCSLM